MSNLAAFIRKEVTEHIRSGKITILVVIFIILGIMNPAIAKLTPWLLETMADTLAESGMTVTEVTVSALDSWVQFFKNLPMGLIAFILFESNSFSKEYQSGTLVLSLTKGLKRHTVVTAKAIVISTLWSALYWLSFGITYAYNAYFWDNGIAQSLLFSVVCGWLIGVFAVALAVFFSTVAKSNTGVLMGIGSIFVLSYILSVIPKLNEYLPTRLLDGNSLIYGKSSPKDYAAALILTLAVIVVSFIASIPIFNKKQL